MNKIKLPLDDPNNIPSVDVDKGIDEPIKPIEQPAPVDKPVETPAPAEEPKEVIVVDDKEYSLDEEGNATLEDGSVFMTKEELEALESKPEDTETEVSIEDIEKLSGIQLSDSEGKKVNYEFTLEGLAKREKDIKELGLREGSNSAISDFFSANPDLYKAFVYKSKKGTLEGFANEPFYKTIQLDSNNEEQLINFIIEAEVKKGSSPQRAKSIANFFKAENKLQEEGVEAHTYLVSLEEQEFNDFERGRVENEKRELEGQKKFYGTYFDEQGKEVIANVEGSVYDKLVAKGKFGNFVIPQDGVKIKTTDGKVTTLSRKQVYDYVSRPVTKEGYTQAQLDDMKRLSNMDTLLYQYMMNLTGASITQLLERRVLEEKSKVIKKRLQTGGTYSPPATASTGKILKVPVK